MPTPTPGRFRVEFVGEFHTAELYDEAGREVRDLDAACGAAERLYGADWESVFDGTVARTRDEHLAGTTGAA